MFGTYASEPYWADRSDSPLGTPRHSAPRYCPEPPLEPPERPVTNKDRLHDEYERLAEKRNKAVRDLSEMEDLLEELAEELCEFGEHVVVRRVTQ